MKLIFWLLDINTNSRENSMELQLWGIDEAGNRVLIVDRNFADYFYAVLNGSANASEVLEEIKLVGGHAVEEAKIVSRRFFGKPVTAIKVICEKSAKTRAVAKQIDKLDGVATCLESDFRFSMRYLIDMGIVPCSWHQVEVVPADNSNAFRVAQIYQAVSPPKLIENNVVPPLRVLSFNILCYNREGTPKPNLNPIIAISTVTSTGEKRQFTAGAERNDKRILNEFTYYIQQFDPDIIASYGSNTFDWNYMRERAKKHKLKLIFDRAGIEPHRSVYGHVSITGMANVDLADFAGMFPEVKVKKLHSLSAHLGVATKNEVVEDVLFADYWDDPKKREVLLRFGLDCAEEVKGIIELLLGFAIQLSGLTSLPLDHVMTAATGFRVEWYLIKRAQKTDELLPRRLEQVYQTYTGGLVLTPIPGLHENIAVLDFKSMYPNIMITYNISPDTYIQPGDPEPEGGVNVAPEVGYRFRKQPPGFFKEALIYLIDVRRDLCQTMKKLDSKSVEHQVLDARQKAVKILTNAAYGYAGWVGARWYIKPVAEAASAWGRHIIVSAAEMAKKAAINVVYGDTDSLFIDYNKNKVQKLRDEIKQKLKLDVELGDIYERIFFTAAKKRYAGLRVDGSLDFVGLEVIRGDWAEVAKMVQEHVLEIILREQSPKKAMAYVHQIIYELRHRKVPLSALIIWKSLTKPPEQYAIKTPHVQAAKILIEKGWHLSVGDKVGYVILPGKGALYNRIKPYVYAKLEEVDVDYYVTNQVLPVAARILGFFNVNQKGLLLKESEENQKVKSLTDYF